MSLARTEEQRMLAEQLTGALTRGGIDWHGAVVAHGLDLLGIPEVEGGLGTAIRDAAVVAEVFGSANAGLPWAEHWVATTLGVRATDGPAASDERGALDAAPDTAARDIAQDALTLLHCAELIGLCRTMLSDTVLFTRERKQFGQEIAAFQALRHRMADMAMLLEQAAALTSRAIDAIDDPALAPRMVSAARVLCEDAGRAVGEGAVQIHGAMGLTEELRLGGYFRRTRDLLQRDGTARRHLSRYAA